MQQGSEKRHRITILNTVFDVTDYLSKHPGGKSVLLKIGTEDALGCLMRSHHNVKIIEKRLISLKVGRVNRYSSAYIEEMKALYGGNCMFDMFIRVFESA